MRILITGACGFVGSHLVEELLQNPANEIVSLDRLTYAGRLDRLAHLDRSRIRSMYHDISAELPTWLLQDIGQVDHIVHNGAETHVARAFAAPELFVRSNIVGTFHMLEAARKLKPRKFVYISTDEVFGPAGDHAYTEDEALNPTNPYAATKAAGEILAMSHYRTFGVPVLITRTMNMFGERQNPEKFVPLVIRKILRGETVGIHADSSGEVSTRQWLHARVQTNAVAWLLEHGIVGQRYNIAGAEHSTLDIAQRIAAILQFPLNYELCAPNAPIHDFSYNIDGTKLLAAGWTPPLDFDSALAQTVQWTEQNQKWLE